MLLGRLLSSDAHSRATSRASEFGFKAVDEDEKERLVGNVFHSVASNYDLMNDLMSAGMHRIWKDTVVGMIGLGGMRKPDLQVLDVAGGTGDIAFRIADQMGALAASGGPPPPAPPAVRQHAPSQHRRAARLAAAPTELQGHGPCSLRSSLFSFARRRKRRKRRRRRRRRRGRRRGRGAEGGGVRHQQVDARGGAAARAVRPSPFFRTAASLFQNGSFFSRRALGAPRISSPLVVRV